MYLFSAQASYGGIHCIVTVIATTVSWDCVVSRHRIVDDFFVSALLSFKSARIDLAEACHAAAWKGNMWRTTSPNPVNMAWNIFQSRFIGTTADSCNRPLSGSSKIPSPRTSPSQKPQAWGLDPWHVRHIR